jgi:hypothetical protein
MDLSKHVDQAQALAVQAQLVLQGIERRDLLEHDSTAIADRYDEFLASGKNRYPQVSFE